MDWFVQIVQVEWKGERRKEAVVAALISQSL